MTGDVSSEASPLPQIDATRLGLLEQLDHHGDLADADGWVSAVGVAFVRRAVNYVFQVDAQPAGEVVYGPCPVARRGTLQLCARLLHHLQMVGRR